MAHLGFRTNDEDLRQLESLRRRLPVRMSRSAVAREALRRGMRIVEAELVRPPAAPPVDTDDDDSGPRTAVGKQPRGWSL